MLQYAKIHKSCSCYQKGKKQIISLKEYKKGEAGHSILTSHHILFVLNGAAKYSIPGTPGVTIVVPHGEFIFLFDSTSLIWEVLEDTAVLLFRLNHVISALPECHTFRLQRSLGNLAVHKVENGGIYPLKMNARIEHFIEGVVTTEYDGLKCGNFAKYLIGQLLTMIQVYYTQEEYVRFYSTVRSSNMAFTDIINEKWMECRSVDKLAGLFNMNVRQFTLLFTKSFGETPGVWLQKRKGEYIYHDICNSYKPLRQIAEEYGFSMSNFIRYCRMNFGTTPGVIRENLPARTEQQYGE